jgi:MFS family permease
MRLLHKKSVTNLDYNLYVNNVNGILQAFSINLVIPFASMYAKRLNASDNHIALLNSYPAVFCILSVFLGTFLFRSSEKKKRIITIFFIFSRCFFLIFILIPFLPANIQPGLFVLFYGMMNFPSSIANIGWQSFLADLFPEQWRGRAFSKRSSLSTVSALIVTFITGNLLFYIPKNNGQRIHLYQFFFLIAFAVGILEILSFSRHKLDRNSTQIERVSDFGGEHFLIKVKNIILLVFSNQKFLFYCICVFLFHFSWQLAWPIFFTYEVDILHSNESWTSMINTVSFITQAISFPIWQRVSEKKGNNFTIFLSTLLISFPPIAYTLLVKNMYHAVLVNIISGISVSGITLSLLNNLYEVTPNENRTLFIGVYTIVTNITLMFAPLIGMQLKEVVSIENALLIAGILRILASSSFLLRYLRGRKSIFEG